MAHAERVLKAELSRRGWADVELGRRRKGDPEKVAIASQLRARATMTLKWIAQRLKMGGNDAHFKLPGAEAQEQCKM